MLRGCWPPLVLLLTLAAPQGAAPAAEPKAAALVDGKPITVGEAERELRELLGRRTATAEEREALARQALAVLVQRRLALRYLTEQKLAASEADVSLELKRFEAQLAQRGETLPAFAEREGLSLDALRELARWRLSWRQFLEKQLTEQNLQKFFDRRPRDFDGSRVKAAHILFAADPADPDSLTSARKQAAAVRARIASGELTFAAAAREHSQAPTAASGGEVGLVARHGDLPEAVLRALFALEPGQVSEPVTSPFGVHLATCLEIEPGQSTWQDVRPELERAVNRFLFDWTAGQVRERAQIEFTQDWPAPGEELLPQPAP